MALSGWDALALPLSQCGKIGGETYRREENALTDILGFTVYFRRLSPFSDWFSLVLLVFPAEYDLLPLPLGTWDPETC